ncbi:MAG: NADH-quinone oxidoreductase subunit J [Rickettsia sp.]|nr:NADH-quinone oxidoreductase subunit J [Rickettsia sp.]
MLFFFYIFAIFTIICSFMVIFSKNPIHSVFWLVGSFINASSLMILIGAEFIAMLIIIVYVGAIAILFLFVIMMINIKTSHLKLQNLGFSIFSIFLSVAILLCFFFTIIFTNMQNAKQIVKNLDSYFAIGKDKDNIYYIAKFLYSDYILVFQISGMILLASIIASIAITYVPEQYKKQNLFKQLFRNKKDSIELINVKNNSAVSDIKYDSK